MDVAPRRIKVGQAVALDVHKGHVDVANRVDVRLAVFGEDLVEGDVSADVDVGVGFADLVAHELDAGERTHAADRVELEDVLGGIEAKHAIVLVAIVKADDGHVGQGDAAFLRSDLQQHVHHDGAGLDDDVALFGLDVGIGLQLSAADEVFEDDLAARFDVERVIVSADGAGGTGFEGDIALGLDVGTGLVRLSAVQERAGRVRHGDDDVLAGDDAKLVLHALGLDDLLGLVRRTNSLHAAIGTDAQVVLREREVENVVHGLDGQVGRAIVGNAGHAVLGRRVGLEPLGAVEVPEAALRVGGDDVGEALKLHLHARLEGDDRLLGRGIRREGAEQRVGVFEDHVVGLVGGTVEHGAEDDVVLLVRNQHQHLAGILVDVEVVVDAVAVAGHIVVRGHLLQLDGHIFDRAVDVGIVAGRLAAVLGGGLVEVDLVVAELLVALIVHRRGDAHGAVAQGGVVDGHVVDVQRPTGGFVRNKGAVIRSTDIADGVVVIVVELCGMIDVPGQEYGFVQRVGAVP